MRMTIILINDAPETAQWVSKPRPSDGIGGGGDCDGLDGVRRFEWNIQHGEG